MGLVSADDALDCQSKCNDTADCAYFTFNEAIGGCTLFEDCPEINTQCETCTWGPNDCYSAPPIQHSEYKIRNNF